MDNDVPDSVADMLRERGHITERVRDLFPTDTPDPVIAAYADSRSAIVVTCDKDYKRWIQRQPDLNQQRYRRAGRINLECPQAQARRRLEQFMETVEFEYDLAQTRRDKRCIFEITSSYMRIER